MEKELKQFIENAAKIGKNRKYVRDYLYGKISELEIVEALEYFDYLQKKKESCFKKYFMLIGISFRIFVTYIIYVFLKIAANFKNLFFEEKTEEIDFEKIEGEFNLRKFFNGIKKWYLKKSTKEKKKFLILSMVFFLVFLLLVYANFFYYKKCENPRCFLEMVKNCNRALYESEDFILLINKVEGAGLNKCVSEIIHVDKETKKRIKMRCSLPPGSSFLPYSNLEFCSGELREFIQEKIILELNRVVGENILELNPLFRK